MRVELGPITEFESVHAVLQAELSARVDRNPAYSLRAFSRDLGVSAARLSEIINGGQSFSMTTATKLAQGLFGNDIERGYFVIMARSEFAKSEEERERARSALAQHASALSRKELDQDAFQFIARWYFLAILELMRIPEFHCEPTAIAARLGIEEAIAQRAVKILERLGLIATDDTGVYHVVTQKTHSGDYPVFSSAVRNYHAEILDKAKAAIDDKPRAERNLMATTVAINKRRLPEYIARLNALHREFVDEVEADPDPDDVYCIAMQMFSLSSGPDPNGM